MKQDDFAERVYWLVTRIPFGRLATYGQIAGYAGSPRAARAVGTLLRHSLANFGELPWQRVINAQGRISFKGDLGRAELQRALLEAEGVVFDDQGRCDLNTLRWQPREIFWDVD